MKRILRLIYPMAALFMSLGPIASADAALQAAGPVSTVTTLPSWYQDANSLALGQCLDQNNFCVLTPAFDPLITNPPAPITATGPINNLNFPDESFYFLADALMNVGPSLTGKARIRFALEGAFLAGVVPNQGITFLRINMQKIAAGLTPNSTFTVTHPYGTFQFTSDATGASGGVGGVFAGQTFRTEDPLAPTPGIYFPPDLQAATTTGIGPFLVASGGPVTDPVTGNRYIGNPALPTTVTGSPLGNNFFRIDGPNIGGPAINTIQTTLFTLAGKIIGLDVQPATIIDHGTNNIVIPVAAPKTVTVTNTTGNSIIFPTLAAAGADSLDFIITPSATVGTAPFCSGATVAAGAKCSFDVTFTPTASLPAHAARVATIALTPTTAIPPAPVGTSDPPPVTIKLSGTAQVTVNATAGLHGTITPITQNVGAGATVNLTVTPSNNKFKVKEVADGPSIVSAPYVINAGNVNHSVTASFMPSGDLNADGILDINDALKALKILAGVQQADVDDPDNTALKVAPLVGGVPVPDAGRTQPNIADVLAILRRVLNLDKW
jgi:hypothetical protein